MIIPLPLHSSDANLKGNSGKARSRRQRRRILTAIFSCLAIICIYELSGLGGNSRKHKEKQRRMKKVAAHQHMEKVNYEDLTKEEQIDLVIAGKVHLVGIEVDEPRRLRSHEYEGALIGNFCRLDFFLHKNDPSSYPMFHFLLDASEDCKNPFSLELYSVIQAVKSFDEESATNSDGVIDLHNGDVVRQLKPSGLVFHESRCGSTLAANSLAAMEPSMNRVYSESSPPIVAAKVCGFDGSKCPPGRGAEILRDIMMLMGRSDSEEESQLFFKIQSIGTKAMGLFREAFPDTPWIFIYREPVEVMMSQLEHGPKRANCVRQLRDVPDYNIDLLAKDGMTVNDLSPVDKCALHLSLLCDEAVRNLEDDLSQKKLGRGVSYQDLAVKLMDDIIPNHFKITLTDENRENILGVSQNYSKGAHTKKKGSWKSDSEEKEKNASPEIREAAEYFLQNSYDWFENEQGL